VLVRVVVSSDQSQPSVPRFFSSRSLQGYNHNNPSQVKKTASLVDYLHHCWLWTAFVHSGESPFHCFFADIQMQLNAIPTPVAIQPAWLNTGLHILLHITMYETKNAD